MTLVLLRWETRHFTWQATGTTEAEAWAVLRAMWGNWCRRSGADRKLLDQFKDDVMVVTLTPGAAYRDWEPYDLPKKRGNA